MSIWSISCARIYHIYIQEHLERANHVEPIIINNLSLENFFRFTLLFASHHLTWGSSNIHKWFNILLDICWKATFISIFVDYLLSIVLYCRCPRAFWRTFTFFPVSSPSLQQMLLIFLFYLLFYFYTTLLLALPTDQNHNSTHTKCVHRIVWYLGGKITVYLSRMHNVFLPKKGKQSF